MDNERPEPNVDASDVAESTDKGGYSSGEKVVGAAAAYSFPLLTGLAASAALKGEADPARRRQLSLLRNGAFVWAGVGLVGAVIALVVFVSWAGSNGSSPDGPVRVDSVSGACQGAPVDRHSIDLTEITYDSTDNVHWTATVPCADGGVTSVPVPAAEATGGP